MRGLTPFNFFNHRVFLLVFAMSANAQEELPNLFHKDGSPRVYTDVEKVDPHIVSTYKDKSRWNLWYLAMTTRSEGLHGELIAPDGKLITGKKLGEKKVVQGVMYVWNGSFEKRKNLFDKTGWLPEKLDEYYPSRKVIERAFKKSGD